MKWYIAYEKVFVYSFIQPSIHPKNHILSPHGFHRKQSSAGVDMDSNQVNGSNQFYQERELNNND